MYEILRAFDVLTPKVLLAIQHRDNFLKQNDYNHFSLGFECVDEKEAKVQTEN
jgi:hypothetical protein